MRARSRPRTPADALARSVELLTRVARDEASRARAAGKNYVARTPAIVAGSRRNFDVLDVPTRKGSAGIGIDATEAEAMRSELNRLNDAHRRTLDQLATGVAIFTADQRLTFYNAAYRSLWELDGGFLDQNPTDSAVLDQLRAARKLPEETGLPRVEGRPARGLSRARGRASMSGICPTAAPCASSPRPIRRAA